MIKENQQLNYILRYFSHVFLFSSLLIISSCSADSKVKLSYSKNIVNFIDGISFGSVTWTESFFWSDNKVVTYTKFDSLGHITRFKRFTLQNIYSLTTLLQHCKVKKLTKSPKEINIVSDYQGPTINIIQVGVYGELNQENCPIDPEFKQLWYQQNIELENALKYAEDMQRGKYLRLIPYYGSAKPDVVLTHEQVDFISILSQPYQFLPGVNLSSNSIPATEIGVFYIVRMNNHSYAMSWYDF